MAFDPDTPTPRSLVQQAIADVDAEMADAGITLMDDAPEYVLAAVCAGLVQGCYGTIRQIARDVVPGPENSPEALQMHARQWLGTGGGRLDAKPARLPLTGTGTAGTEMPEGTTFRRSDGALFATTEVLIYGEDDITVQSIAAEGEAGYGADGNTVPGTELTLVSEIPGGGLDPDWLVDGDPADGEIGGGSDQETHEALAERVQFAGANPPRAGTGPDYIAWTKSISSLVGRVWPRKGERGPGIVTVWFTRRDVDNPIPDTPLVELVQAGLEELVGMSVGQVYATAPVANPINFEIAIKPNTAAIRDAVEAALEEAIALQAEPGTSNGSIYFDLSWASEAVSKVVGETGHTILSPLADVTLALGYLPTLGTITFSTKA